MKPVNVKLLGVPRQSRGFTRLSLNLDVRQMAETVADAINGAEAGAIINQSEEQVRDAHAVLRKATYQKALSLLEKNQRAFSPSAESSRDQLE
jgi:molybdopterin-guanine dinucleotide biosynthesis protein A